MTRSTHTSNHMRRLFVARKLFAVMLALCLVIIELAGSREARAEFTFSVTPGGTIAVGNFVPPPTYNKCGDAKPRLANYPNSAAGYEQYNEDTFHWDNCYQSDEEEDLDDYVDFILGRPMSMHTELPAKTPTGSARASARSSSSGTPNLGSSTPGLPFLGNSLVVISYALNAAALADATTAYKIGLRRQPDCSIAEDLILPNAATPNTPNADFFSSLSDAQDYFHQLAGLTTTPDVFAKGCSFPFLGQPSSGSVSLLGATAAGAVISAEPANAGLYISTTDTTANIFKSTLSFPSTTLGSYATADVNGDGILDLVLTFITDPATQQLSTAVFLGNGDGTFKAGAYYDIQGDITVDDVNGDGNPDIVVCGLTSGITTLIGKGDGTFTPSALSASGITPCGPSPGQVISGDFNGDGKKDLLVHDTVLLGNGNGTFTVGSPISTSTSFLDEFSNTAVGDLNNDGKLDVVVEEGGYVAVFYGNGDGTFTAGPRYAALPDLMQVSLTDIDGDGNLDIVLGTSTGGVYTDECCSTSLQPPLFQILMGRGDGTFVDSNAYNQGTFSSGGPQIANADFNGDGKTDALVFSAANGGTRPTSNLAMLPGNGTAQLGAAVTSTVTLTPTMLVAADMNKDGKPDAVLAGSVSGSAALAVMINQGNGTFAGEQDYALPSAPVSLAVGDFNGDGLMDVAVGVNPGQGGSGPSGVYVLWGQANHTLAAAVQMDTSLNPTGLTAGDINGDGRTDLVVADQGFLDYVGASDQVNGAVHVYLGNANGTFTAAASPTTSATNYSVAALGDLNGDGKLDLILGGNVIAASGAEGAPSIYTLLGNGDGTFQAANTTALAGLDGIGATSIALADFNKDGHLDVAIGNPIDFTEVLLGNGDGALLDTLMTLGQTPSAIAAADLNGDGFPELLVGSVSNIAATGVNNLYVFRNANTWGAAATSLTATTTTLTSSATSIASGQALTLTATVAAGSGATAPAGTVTFLNGTTTLGSGTLGTGGTATLSTSTLTIGAQSLTASYGGSATFAGSTSSAVTVTVTAGSPDFTVALNPTTGTVAPGESATTTVTLTPSNGFDQTVALSCSGLPTGATCSFSSASVAVNGAAATSTLTIATMAATAMNSARKPFDPLAPGGVLLAGIFGLPLIWRRRQTAARWLRGALLALLCVSIGTLLQSCGGSGGSSGSGGTGGTAAGSYMVTVTASVGSTTHTATYALTVN